MNYYLLKSYWGLLIHVFIIIQALRLLPNKSKHFYQHIKKKLKTKIIRKCQMLVV